MTYSIIGFDQKNGDLGVAVQSKFPNVGSLVSYAKAPVGAIVTQGFSNPSHGVKGLSLLELGASPEQVISIVTDDDELRAKRQVAVINHRGHVAAYTGDDCYTWKGWAGSKAGLGCSAQGNGLANQFVVDAMVDAFEGISAPLADRLIAALQAAEAAGGELRGQQSAALLVVREKGGYGGVTDRLVDISIYDNVSPIDELSRCYKLHELSYFPSDPTRLVNIDDSIAVELKALMSRLGFYSGDLTPAWESKEILALQDFMGWENYDNRIRSDNLIDLDVLEDIRRKPPVL